MHLGDGFFLLCVVPHATIFLSVCLPCLVTTTTFSPHPKHIPWDHCTLPLTLALQPCPPLQGTGELLAPGSLHPMTAPPEVSLPLISIGQRWTQTLISVLSEPPSQGCEMRLLFSQHPLTALRKWLVPISCWRLFNHLTWFFNFHCSCPYISILANGMPRELSSSKF